MVPWAVSLIAALYVVACVASFKLYSLQRTALMICRSNDLPTETRFLFLPRWYTLWGWPVLLSKWTLLTALALTTRWWLAVVVGLAQFFLISTALPIPHVRNADRIIERLHRRGSGHGADLDREMLVATETYRLKALISGDHD